MQNSSSTQNPPTPQSVRVIHGALTSGVILFGIVAHFVLLPNHNISGNLDSLIPVLLTIALGLCAVSMLLMKRVPRPSPDESSNAFWLRAASPALITWTPVEAAALLSVVTYSQTGSAAALVVAAVAVLIFGLLRPGYFESR
jgi:hypothetical protein